MKDWLKLLREPNQLELEPSEDGGGMPTPWIGALKFPLNITLDGPLLEGMLAKESPDSEKDPSFTQMFSCADVGICPRP